MYICIYTYMYMCMCMDVYIYSYITECLFMYPCANLRKQIHMFLHLFNLIHITGFMCQGGDFTYMYIYISIDI
jgi:hypothetical protein